jgi:hypothetical protein
MNLLRASAIFIFLTAFIACNAQKKEKTKTFSVSVKTIKGDTILSSTVYYNGYILCLQEDSKLFVLDTAFNFVDTLTNKFSNLKIELLHAYNDTILLATGKDIFYLDSGFTLKKYTTQPFKYGLPYYDDSAYYVHACSVEEWGGSVFFLDKKTNKTYSYPATDVQQVLKFKGRYIVNSYLAHMSGFSDYLSIEDPAKLYELKDERQKRFCNWWTADSIKKLKLFDTITPAGVKYYADKFTTRTINVFPYNDTLYSIYTTDSATILAKHVNFRLVPIDTLLKRNISFSRASTHLTKDIVVTTYNESWGMATEDGKTTYYQNMGLILIKGNKITFLEFKTPHMWQKNRIR